MRTRKSKPIAAFIFVIFFSAVIMGAPPAMTAEKCKETKYVTITGGAATGGGYVVISKWAELMTKGIPCVSASATTGGYINNTFTVNNKQFTFGQGDPNVLYTTTRGLVEKAKGKEPKNLRFINSVQHASFHIFVPKNHPIKAVKDIATYPCRNVMVMARLAGHYEWVGKIFEAYGTSFADLEKRGGSLAYVDYTGAVDLMKDGQADILMIHTTVPASNILDIDANPGIRFLPIEPEIRKKLTKTIPGMVEVTIPGGSYKNLPEDYHTVGLHTQHYTHRDVSDDLIYNATKVFWEHEKDFQQLGAWAKQIQLKNALINMVIPLHPGAERYYKEVGVKAPKVDWPW